VVGRRSVMCVTLCGTKLWKDSHSLSSMVQTRCPSGEFLSLNPWNGKVGRRTYGGARSMEVSGWMMA
jgi:hypothetical protein